ncbi:MAG: hypothetical protein JXA13_12585 [Anaerolineales bacterium]|nr:hypothetical protein [Anaerolineales bacterium]
MKFRFAAVFKPAGLWIWGLQALNSPPCRTKGSWCQGSLLSWTALAGPVCSLHPETADRAGNDQVVCGWGLYASERVHRAHIAGPKKPLPGWHELTREEVRRSKEYDMPWDEKRLVVDTTRWFEERLTLCLRM